MKEKLKQINLFGSPNFLLFMIIMIMWNNLEHVADVYAKITLYLYPEERHDYIRLQAYFVAIVFDFTVIAFIYHGQWKESLVFAFILFIVNIIFWDVYTEMHTTYPYQYRQASLVFAKVLYSAVFSFLIHRSSTLYFELKNGFSKMKQAAELISNNKAALELAKATIEQKEELIKQKEASVLDLKNTLKGAKHFLNLQKAETEQMVVYKDFVLEFSKCPNCEFTAPINKGIDVTLKSINAHKGTCKKGGKNE